MPQSSAIFSSNGYRGQWILHCEGVDNEATKFRVRNRCFDKKSDDNLDFEINIAKKYWPAEATIGIDEPV